MEMFQRLMAQLRAYWAGLSSARRVLIVGAAGLVFAAVSGWTYLNQPAGYVPLYRGEAMSNEDAAAVIASMKKLSQNYKLDPVAGITVPADKVNEYQVALAGEGIPVRGSGKGYELFDDSNSLTSTPFKDQVTYLRAQQAELARTISQFDGVKAARVQIARPEQTLFVREQAATKASVSLTLKPNAVFGQKQAASVVALVSNAVVGLRPENVVVVANGVQVSDPHAGDRDVLPTKQLDFLRQIEAYLTEKAEKMLRPSLGHGKAVVQVSVELDMKKVKERISRVVPEEKAVEREMTRTNKSTNAPPGGVAGAGSNIRQASSGGRGGGTSNEELTQTDYKYTERLIDMEELGFIIKRLTVSAAIDNTAPPAGDGQPAAPSVTPQQAEELIRNAVGFTAARGDIITVSANKFAQDGLAVPEPDEEAAQLQRLAAYVALARNVCLAVAVVMALCLVPLLLLRRRKKVVPPPASETAVTPSPEQRRQQLLDRLADLTRSDPDKAARVFGLLVGATAG